jgi:transcriptional regulator with XRE-family HTH domain
MPAPILSPAQRVAHTRVKRLPIDPSARMGRVIRRLRDEQGVSQEDLAEAARLDRTFISMLERGRQRATLETALALAQALGLSLSELAREIEAEQQAE